MRTLVLAVMCAAFLSGCDTTERLNKLEKENAELKAALQQQNVLPQLEMENAFVR